MHLKKHKIRTLTWVIAWSLVLPQAAILEANAQSANVYERLINYEKVLFGEQTSGESADKRIQNLEKQIFGKVQKGSNEQRLDAIGKLIEGQKNSAYFPPIPPQLDRSGFAPEPKAAPKNSTLSTDTLAPLTANTDDRVHSMLRQAMGLYSQGKVNEAQKVYQQVLALDFHNTDANFNLGSIAEDRQDYASATKYYAAASAADPSDLEIKDALKNAQEKSKRPPTVASRPTPQATVPQTLPPISEDSTALKQIAADAAVSYKKGNFDDAISKLNYLAKKNPYDANTQFALGQAWRGKGNNGEALKHLRAAATLNPKNDLYVSTLNQTQSSSSSQQIAASNEPGPVGEITPFQGIPSNDLASGNLGGSLGQIQGLLGRALPGMMIGGQIDSYGMGMGMGSMGGFGGLGGGLPYFGSATANGYPMMQTGGTRITRVMRAALSGAAMGALSNRGYPGGMTAGAKQGALYGGLIQMMTGGF